MNKWSFVSLALVVGVGCAVACSSSGDDTSAPSGGSGGAAGKAGGGSGGTTSTAGKGGSGTAGTSNVGEAGAGGGGSIYDDLGQEAGIRQAVAAIVTAEVMDNDIATYFSQQADTTHSPTVQDIEDCLVIQLSEATGGPDTYAGSKATSGFKCRSMAEAHADLNINSGTFTKFVTIAATVLSSAPFNVPNKDLGPIGTVLAGLEPAIVTANPDSDTSRPCTAPAACAAAAGAGGTN